MDELPYDVLIHLFNLLDEDTLGLMCEVCNHFYKLVTKNAVLNQKLKMIIYHDQLKNRKKQAMLAVLNSERHFQKVHIEYWLGVKNPNCERHLKKLAALAEDTELVLELLKHIGSNVRKLSFGSMMEELEIPIDVMFKILGLMPNIVELSVLDNVLYKSTTSLESAEAPILAHVETLNVPGDLLEHLTELRTLKRVTVEGAGKVFFEQTLPLQKSLTDLTLNWDTNDPVFEIDIIPIVSFTLVNFVCFDEGSSAELTATQITNLVKFLYSQTRIKKLKIGFATFYEQLLPPIIDLNELKDFQLEFLSSTDVSPSVLQYTNSSVKEMQFDIILGPGEVRVGHIVKIISCFQGLLCLKIKIFKDIIWNAIETLSLDHMKNLQEIHLDLNGFYWVKPRILPAIRMKSLKSLRVQLCDNTVEDWTKLAQNCPNITSINLVNCTVDNASIETIAQHCQKVNETIL